MSSLPAVTVNGPRRDEIGEASRRCLLQSPYPLLRNVACRCRRGVLFLRGRLPNYYHKQLAQEAVRRVAGVTRIVNQIEIGGPAPARAAANRGT